MDDYNSNVLNDSKNEWCIRLMNILSGHIIDGFRAIFNEALTLCERNDEVEKYLMTFQNLLAKIKDWNQITVENECERIKKTSNCPYLEDLVTCVHIIQLKILSCVRVTNKNKKIDIDIPDVNKFLHRVYVNIARKLYSNIYLFQIDVTPLEQQKNNREIEIIVQTCIMNTIRDNIPIDQLLRQYIDETQEVDVETVENVIASTPPEVPPEERENIPSELPTVKDSTISQSLPNNDEEMKSVDASSISLVEPNALSTTLDVNNPDKEVPKEPELNVSFSTPSENVDIGNLEKQFEEETKLKLENKVIDNSIQLNLDSIESLDELNNVGSISSTNTSTLPIDLGAEVLEL